MNENQNEMSIQNTLLQSTDICKEGRPMSSKDMRDVFTGTLGLSKSLKPPKEKIKGGKIPDCVFDLTSFSKSRSRLLFSPIMGRP